jgi:pyruvate kinase
VVEERLQEVAHFEAMDGLRLVYSPNSDKKILTFMKNIRKIRQDSGLKHVPIIIDIATHVRGYVSDVGNKQELNYGDIVTIGTKGSKADLIIVSDEWDGLFAQDVTVFLGHGSIVCKVKKLIGPTVEVEITQGGEVFPRMEIQVPETKRPPSIELLKVFDFKTFSEAQIDFLVVPGDVPDLATFDFFREVMPNGPWLIAKIDSRASYENIDNIIPKVDGLMISRREMALSLEPATIPMVTKEIIQKCNDKAKLVITASEMLGSMGHNPTPTRAEVSDVANAVIDGTDAVVLSEDIGFGQYCSRAIEVGHSVIADVELNNSDIVTNWLKEAPVIRNELDAVAFHAYQTANRVGAKAIVCITEQGNTALKLASFRGPKPIIAVTFSPEVNRRLSLVRGVEGVVLDIDPTLDELLPNVNDLLKRKSWLNAGDAIVFVTVTISSVGKEASNLFTVQILN